MIFEYPLMQESDILLRFSEMFQTSVFKNRLLIPEPFGKGSISTIEIEPGFTLMVHNFTLRKEFTIKRGPFVDDDFAIIAFNMGDLPFYRVANFTTTKPTELNSKSAFIESPRLESIITFQEHTNIQFVKIRISRHVLNSLLNLRKPNATTMKILRGNDAFLFVEDISPEMSKVLSQLLALNEFEDLSPLYFKIKGQELLYHLFSRLQKAEHVDQPVIYETDVNNLFLIRALILSDLSRPPVIASLAKKAKMSETKLMKLFKQVFGDTIYNCFQKNRMEQAALLLKQRDHSVSEIGYKLGFTNLSHFGRLFERYHGLPPKKYTTHGGTDLASC